MTEIGKDTQRDRIETFPSRLGHNDIGFTLRRYTHLMAENQGLPADDGGDGNRRALAMLSSQILRPRATQNGRPRATVVRWWRGRDLNP